jgi:hypothetical protein
MSPKKIFFINVLFCFIVFPSYGSDTLDNKHEEVKMPKGYVQQIQEWKNNLSEEEIKILKTISKMSVVLSGEKDIEIITKQLFLICPELWGELENTGMSMVFNISRSHGKNFIGDIIISLPDKNNICQFHVTRYSSSRNMATISMVVLGSHLKLQNKMIYFIFYPNGNLKQLGYRNKILEEIDVIKTWSEDGTFLKEEIINQPRPMNIQM